jgi:hypothetical protein
MRTSRAVTTSFPLGLFCNATLSGELPQITKSAARANNQPIEPPNFPPIILEVDNIDDTYWDDSLDK